MTDSIGYHFNRFIFCIHVLYIYLLMCMLSGIRLEQLIITPQDVCKDVVEFRMVEGVGPPPRLIES